MYLLLGIALPAAAGAGFCLARCAARGFAARRRLLMREKLTLSQALEDPVFAFALLAAVSCVAAMALTPSLLPLCLLASAVFARKMPAYLERRHHELIRASCEKELSMFCDIVAMGIDAGLSFDAALKLYCARFDNELSRRVGAAQECWEHAITSREAALEAMADEIGSPSVKRFADTASRAVAQGAPLAEMLRRLAMALRQVRKAEIEREVAKAPVKMLVPTGVFILPAMLLLVMGPMLLQFMGT